MTIFGDDYPTPDGTCVRDYIDVRDLCEAHWSALKALMAGKASGIFNLGSGKGFSVKEVIDSVSRISGRKVSCKIAPRRPGDPAVLVADPSKAKKILGLRPKRTLEESITSAWHWEQTLLGKKRGVRPDTVRKS